MKACRRFLWFASMTALFPLGRAAPSVSEGGSWVGSWVSAQQLTEPGNMPPAPGLAGGTLREVLRPTLSGSRVRVTVSNVFGNGPLVLSSVHLARSAGGSRLEAGTDTALTFDGSPSVTVEAGASMISDAAAFDVTAFQALAVSMTVQSAPSALTGHPGSRTTSYLQPGNAADALNLPDARTMDHWYMLSAVDVWTAPPAAAVVVLGDSITDGRGSTTNGNDRWPDDLAGRLAANAATAHIAVLNQGIGGNRLLRDGLGPNVLARFDRDVLGPPGVRWLIVFEGINDIGTAVGARARHWPAATAQDLIAGLKQVALRAHDHGLRVYGATITPFEGFKAYYDAESEAERQAVNQWIRTTGELDGVIDFDAAVRDPADPKRLQAAADSGDHLHLSPAGYRVMAGAVDLGLFSPVASGGRRGEP